MKKYYAGIGSRKTPKEVLLKMKEFSRILSDKGFILRSGGASGADKAFESGITDLSLKEIFYANDALPWAFDEVKKYVPSDRKNFDTWKPYTKKLLARNMMQVLGSDGSSPVEFILCWSPSLNYLDSSSGGTAWALRCGLSYNIPIFNLLDPKQEALFIEKYLK